MTNALHEAASAGDLETVRALSAHSDVDSADEMGRTPLMRAAGRGHSDIVSLLLSYHADVHALDKFKMDAPLIAVQAGHRSIAGQLVESGSVLGLAEAAAMGDEAAVRDLLVGGYSIESKNMASMTALHGAATGGHLKLVEFLLRRGANVHARDGQGSTALFRAVQRKYVSVAEVLIEAGSDVNVPGMFGHTALRTAGMMNDISLMRLLLTHGARPDGTDPRATSLLFSPSSIPARKMRSVCCLRRARIRTASRNRGRKSSRTP